MSISAPTISNSRDTTTLTKLNQVGTIAGGIVPVTGTSTTAPSATGTALATLKVTETGEGAVRQTIIEATAMPLAITDTLAYASALLYTFPQARINILGCLISVAETTTSAIASTLNNTASLSVALGTAAASNIALTSTMVDIAPLVATASSATINVEAAVFSTALAAAAQFDGTSTAKGVYFNVALPTNTDIDADATTTFRFKIIITWINLGDLPAIA